MFEYQCFVAHDPQNLETRLNTLARDGWRLHTMRVAVVPSVDGLTVGTHLLAVVERLRPGEEEQPDSDGGAMACRG